MNIAGGPLDVNSVGTNAPVRKMLVLDTSYTLEMVRSRGLDKPILCRDLDGFFAHVWSVHPFASLLTSDAWGPRYGTSQSYELSARHTVIEGKIGRFAWLKWLPPVNFLLSQIELFRRLRRLMRDEAVSVVRAPSPLYTGLLGLVLARRARVPLVIRVGANFDELRAFTGKPIEPRLMRSARIEKLVERFVFPRADLVAGANQNNLDYALANGARSEQSTLFRYGNLIDPAHFVDLAKRRPNAALLEELGVGGSPFLIGVGRLEETASVKHPDDVIRVAAALVAEGKDVKLVLVGDGPLRPRLEVLIAELGLKDRVILAGNRDQKWLADIFPQAAVHVCPQAGRALSEAALASVPTVAYDIDWQRELIETDRTGILVPYRDLPGLIRATRRLLDDRVLAKKLGANLRERALDMLDPERLDTHERHEYSRLLGRGSSNVKVPTA